MLKFGLMAQEGCSSPVAAEVPLPEPGCLLCSHQPRCHPAPVPLSPDGLGSALGLSLSLPTLLFFTLFSFQSVSVPDGTVF